MPTPKDFAPKPPPHKGSVALAALGPQAPKTAPPEALLRNKGKEGKGEIDGAAEAQRGDVKSESPLHLLLMTRYVP